MPELRVEWAVKKVRTRIDDDGTVVIANDYTTIGYATSDADAGLITYIFVNPTFRRRGYGSMLVRAAIEKAGKPLKPANPISPLGAKFFGL